MEELITDKKQSLMDPPKEKMTKSELENFCADFEAHFGLARSGGHIKIPNTRHSWPWQAVLDLVKKHSTHAVAGLFFHYGLDGDDLVLLLELYYLNEHDYHAPTRVPDSIYQWRSTKFEKITTTELNVFVDRYVDQVKVMRTVGAEWDDLSRGGPRPDPRGIWYPFEGKIDVLMQDNEKLDEERYVVISSIAPELSYSEMKEKRSDDKEYRHMLALHVAKLEYVDGEPVLVDQLDDEPDSGNYAMRAMDIGCLCPPNCLK